MLWGRVDSHIHLGRVGDGELINKSKATRIIIEYEDGTVLGAKGDHAEEISQWWQKCETIAIQHGWFFKGTGLIKHVHPEPEKLKIIRCPKCQGTRFICSRTGDPWFNCRCTTCMTSHVTRSVCTLCESSGFITPQPPEREPEPPNTEFIVRLKGGGHVYGRGHIGYRHSFPGGAFVFQAMPVLNHDHTFPSVRTVAVADVAGIEAL